MIQSEILHTLWPIHVENLNLDLLEMNSTEISSILDFTTIEFHEFALSDYDVLFPAKDFSQERSSGQSMEEREKAFSLILPGEEMEINTDLIVFHLLEAYGESVENGQIELSEEILNCLNRKVSPFGEATERLAYMLSQDYDQQSDFLKQESYKNFEMAFKVFYQLFPYGRFAHFVANSAILDAMPNDVQTIHIVDFDIGEGIQWAQIFDAIAMKSVTLKLTSMKWEDEYDFSEDTLMRLKKYGASFGIGLNTEEITLEELVIRAKIGDVGVGEWLVFNCMVGLPHMGRKRSKRYVLEFLRVGKELIGANGIITFGDESLGHWYDFRSFYNGFLDHYKALLESMDSCFPFHLGEARLTMECLFVSPYVSAHGLYQKWEQIREDLKFPFVGLGGWEMSDGNLMEAKELAREGESFYGVRIGVENNEMVLEWRGIPLVRVSTWRNQCY